MVWRPPHHSPPQHVGPDRRMAAIPCKNPAKLAPLRHPELSFFANVPGPCDAADAPLKAWGSWGSRRWTTSPAGRVPLARLDEAPGGDRVLDSVHCAGRDGAKHIRWQDGGVDQVPWIPLRGRVKTSSLGLPLMRDILQRPGPRLLRAAGIREFFAMVMLAREQRRSQLLPATSDLFSY
ncbi:hypothetical protein BKA80DRAFT_281562 [Phyllosticta citrichinensis]